MFGAIIGDMCGAPYENNPIISENFDLITDGNCLTDDSILTLATIKALLTDFDYKKAYYDYGNKYTGRGYGPSFLKWLDSKDPKPYNSYGNGSAMRVGPIGVFFDSIDEVLKHSKMSAECTHNHPEGIKGGTSSSFSSIYG